MIWMVTVLVLAIGIVTLLVVLGKDSVEDLGSVSARWVAEHRVDAA